MSSIHRFVVASALLLASSADAASGYLRFPAAAADRIAFTAEGDLWSAGPDGGAARRLTTHPGEESRAAISPDGRWIAFSAGYEGPVEAYVMPVDGGEPKRISFDKMRTLVLGWTAQGDVLVSAPTGSGPASLRIVASIDPVTLKRQDFPLADANDAAISADGKHLYFVRFGLSLTNDNARGYRGGAMAQLWRWRIGSTDEATRIGPTDANLRRPMPWRDRLIVISDRDGHDNLWSLASDGSDPKPLTKHADFAVRSASIAGDRIVYQLGADLRRYDLASNQDKALPVDLVSDFEQRRERWIDKPLKWLTAANFAADGERVALTARGRVAIASASTQRRVDIASGDDQRLREAVLSVDGKYVYAIGDGSGEEEIWRFPADGSPGGKALTKDGDTRRWHVYPSPDGRWLAHDDKRGRLWLLDLASSSNRLLDDGGKDGATDYASVTWSADSKAVAVVRSSRAADDRKRIGLIPVSGGDIRWLTTSKYESDSPTFSKDGRWLWFLSDRQFEIGSRRGPWGDRNTGASFDKRSRIYAIALQPGQRFPWQPRDELAAPKPKPDDADKKGGKDKSDGDKKSALPAIVFDGLAERLYEAPLPAGNYGQLVAGDNRLFVLESDGGPLATLKSAATDSEPPKLDSYADKVKDYALSADGKQVLLRRAGKDDADALLIVKAGAKIPDDLSRASVSVDDWNLRIDPRAEWRQMFADAWRMHRAYFFDAKLRGVDWPAARARYQPLLDRLTDRSELDDLLAQMMGELGALHSQVAPGDVRKAEPALRVGGLGAQLQRGERGWTIAHIYRTEAELPSERAPLQAPGVDAKEGDVIVAINGQPTAGVRDIYDLLRNQAGKQVLLELSRGGKSHRVVVVATDDGKESALRYNDWEQQRLAIVEQRGNGRLGYLHLRAMGPGDMAAFVREFYAQFDRDGLIIDVRRNRGGNIDSWIIEKLLRRSWAFWSRYDGQPYTNMQQTFRGHLVVLTDQLTYSDGETFAAGVKALKLGPLIGTRTAGAGVWLSDGNVLADNGRARVAEFPQFGMDGQWLVEGIGVDPDIVVDNLPFATGHGGDQQLDAAIGYLKDKLAKEPVLPLKALPMPALR